MITPAQRAAMERDTTYVPPDVNRPGFVAVKAIREDPEDDAFFIDQEWLEWFDGQHPEARIVGSMIDVWQDTDEAYVWVAVLETR